MNDHFPYDMTSKGSQQGEGGSHQPGFHLQQFSGPFLYRLDIQLDTCSVPVFFRML